MGGGENAQPMLSPLDQAINENRVLLKKFSSLQSLFNHQQRQLDKSESKQTQFESLLQQSEGEISSLHVDVSDRDELLLAEAESKQTMNNTMVEALLVLRECQTNLGKAGLLQQSLYLEPTGGTSDHLSEAARLCRDSMQCLVALVEESKNYRMETELNLANHEASASHTITSLLGTIKEKDEAAARVAVHLDQTEKTLQDRIAAHGMLLEKEEGMQQRLSQIAEQLTNKEAVFKKNGDVQFQQISELEQALSEKNQTISSLQEIVANKDCEIKDFNSRVVVMIEKENEANQAHHLELMSLSKEVAAKSEEMSQLKHELENTKVRFTSKTAEKERDHQSSLTDETNKVQSLLTLTARLEGDKNTMSHAACDSISKLQATLHSSQLELLISQQQLSSLNELVENNQSLAKSQQERIQATLQVKEAELETLRIDSIAKQELLNDQFNADLEKTHTGVRQSKQRHDEVVERMSEAETSLRQRVSTLTENLKSKTEEVNLLICLQTGREKVMHEKATHQENMCAQFKANLVEAYNEVRQSKQSHEEFMVRMLTADSSLREQVSTLTDHLYSKSKEVDLLIRLQSGREKAIRENADVEKLELDAVRNEEREGFQSHIHEKDREIILFQERLEAGEKEIKETRTEETALRERCQELEIEVTNGKDSLSRTMKAAEDLVVNINIALGESASSFAGSFADKSRLEESVFALLSQLAEKSAETLSLQKCLLDAESSYNDLHEQAAKHEIEGKDTSMKLEQEKSKCTDLENLAIDHQAKIESASQDLARRSEEMSKLQTSIIGIAQQLGDTEKQRNDMKGQKDVLSRRVEVMEKTISAKDGSLVLATTEQAKFKQIIKDTTEKNSTLSNAFKNCNQLLVETQEVSNKSIQILKNAHTKDLRMAKSTFLNMKNAEHSARTALGEVITALHGTASLEREEGSLEKNVGELQSYALSLIAIVADRLKEIEEVTQNCKELESTNLSLIEESKSLIVQINGVKVGINDNETEITKMQTSETALISEVSKLQGSLDFVKNHCGQQLRTGEATVASFRELMSEKEKYIAESSQKYEAEVKDFGDRLGEALSTNAALSDQLRSVKQSHDATRSENEDRLRMLSEEKMALQNDFYEVQSTFSTLSMDIEGVKEESTGFVKQCHDLNVLAHEKQVDLTALVVQLTSSKKKLEETLEATSQGLEGKISLEAFRLKEKESMDASLNEKEQLFSASLEEVKSGVMELCGAQSELQTALCKAVAEKSTIRSELDILKREATGLSTELLSAQNTSKDMKEHYRSACKELEEQTRDITDICHTKGFVSSNDEEFMLKVKDQEKCGDKQSFVETHIFAEMKENLKMHQVASTQMVSGIEICLCESSEKHAREVKELENILTKASSNKAALIEQADEITAKLKEDIVERSGEVTKLEGELRQLSEDVQLERQSKKAELLEMKDKLDRSGQAHSMISRGREELEARQQENSEVIQRQQVALEKKEDDLREKSLSEEKLKELLSSLEGTLHAVEAKKKVLETEMEEHSREQQSDMDGMNERLTSLRSEHTEVMKECGLLRSSVSSYKTACERMHAELKETKKTMATNDQQRDDALESLQSKINKLHDQLRVSESDEVKYKQKVIEAEQSLRSLKECLRVAEVAASEKENMSSAAQRLADEKTKEIVKLKNACTKLENEVATNNEQRQEVMHKFELQTKTLLEQLRVSKGDGLEHNEKAIAAEQSLVSVQERLQLTEAAAGEKDNLCKAAEKQVDDMTKRIAKLNNTCREFEDEASDSHKIYKKYIVCTRKLKRYKHMEEAEKQKQAGKPTVLTRSGKRLAGFGGPDLRVIQSPPLKKKRGLEEDEGDQTMTLRPRGPMKNVTQSFMNR